MPLFLVSIISFIVFFKIFKIKNKNLKDTAFSLCWLSVGIVFFLPLIRTFLFVYGFYNISELLAYVLQFLTLLIFLTFSYYIFFVSVKSKILRYFLYALMFILTSLYFFHLFNDGLIGPFISDWTAEYNISTSANFYLKILGLIAFVFLILNIFKQLYEKFKLKQRLILKNFLSTLSLLIFLVGGVFELIIASGWMAFFWRIIILLSVFLAYLSYSLEDKYN